MEIPGARWIVAGFGLITCILIAVYVVKAFRDMALGNNADTPSYLEEFQRLRDEGKLNSEEYDRLKKLIPKKIITKTTTNLSEDRASMDEPKFVEIRDNEWRR